MSKFDTIIHSHSQDTDEIDFEKYEHHLSIKMINQDVSFELHLTLKE